MYMYNVYMYMHNVYIVYMYTLVRKLFANNAVNVLMHSTTTKPRC